MSTKPIVNIGQKKHNFSEADWDLFKEKIESKIDTENENDTLLERDDVDAQEIENSLHSWLNIITVTRDEVISKAKLKYFIRGRESDYLKLLETVYTNIIHKLYWTREELEIIKEIKCRIMEENLRLNKEAWETKVESLNDIYKDSKKFWGNIRRLIGSDKDKTEYLIDPNNNNNRIYEDEDKEILYRQIWEKIFEIPLEENQNFDMNNEAQVRTFLEGNLRNIEPYRYADLSRLDNNNVLLKPVRESDILNIIKGFKNKAPGISGINKLILSQLPANAIERYALITNLTL